MTFELWKVALHDDCEREDKLRAFDALDDFALRLFWERGIGPTVREILKDGDGARNGK